MIYCSRLSRVVAVGVMTISCSTVTQVEPADRRLTLIDLAVPATVESAQPLHVQIQYGIGSCETVTAVSGQMTAPDRLEIEVRARYELPVRSTGCPDILFHRGYVPHAGRPTSRGARGRRLAARRGSDRALCHGESAGELKRRWFCCAKLRERLCQYNRIDIFLPAVNLVYGRENRAAPDPGYPRAEAQSEAPRS